MTDIETKAYEAYPPVWKKLCGDGEVDINGERRVGYIKALTEIESIPKVRGWAARDKNGNLNFFLGEPHRTKDVRGEEFWVGHTRMKQPNAFLPDLTWADEPVEVELLIRKI